jgi:predicted lipid-binding transport protein (Tim44 family)
MSDRREDLSTADLADQPPRDAPRQDLREAADVERGEERVHDDLGQGPTAVGDRPAEGAPETMLGRDLPQREEGRPAEAAADRGPAPASVGARTAEPTHDIGAASTATGPLLAANDAEAFRARWTDIQTGFVDAPRQAVEQADGLVAEVMQHLARTFAEERRRLEGQWDRGDDIATDDLRTAFQRYRSFFERLLAT